MLVGGIYPSCRIYEQGIREPCVIIPKPKSLF
jgi:hypothetical protein